MKNILKFFHFLIEPIRFLGSRDFSDKIIEFFDNHPWLVYVLALLISLGILFFLNIYPLL